MVFLEACLVVDLVMKEMINNDKSDKYRGTMSRLINSDKFGGIFKLVINLLSPWQYILGGFYDFGHIGYKAKACRSIMPVPC